MRKFICLSTVLILLLFAVLPCLAEDAGWDEEFDGGYGELEENLIYNGDFELIEGDMPDGWETNMWYTDEGVSTLSVVPDGYEGNCVQVYNASKNDARFTQLEEVEPEKLYRISAMVKMEGGEEGTKGANLSIDNTFVCSEPVVDTHGEWQEIELYGRTAADQYTVTVCLRVGGYGSECKGRALFDNVRMEEVESAPGTAVICDLSTIKPASAEVESSADAEPVRNTQAWTLMACACVVLIIAGTRKAKRSPEREPEAYTKGFVILMGVALTVRIVLAMICPGFRVDINCFTSWGQTMLKSGPLNFYRDVSWCDYPPLYMLMLAPIAWLTNLLELSVYSGGQLLLIKLWTIVFDLLAALLVWRRAKRTVGPRAALLLTALLALNPVVLADGAAWGQVDSVMTLPIALCAIEACDRRYVRSLAAYATALLLKPQALLFGPIGLMFVLADRVRAHRAKEADARRDTVRLFAGMAVALGMLYAVAFVSVYGMCSGVTEHFVRPVSWLLEQYGGAASHYAYMTINMANLWYLLGMNWGGIDVYPTAYAIAWGLMAGSYILCGVMCVLHRSRKDLPLIGATLILMITALGPKMHERYLYPALLLLILAYCACRDRRVLVCAAVLTGTLFLNIVLVLQGGMTDANTGHLNAAENWINCPVSVVNVLLALFAAYTAFDITVLGHIQLLSEPGPVSAVREVSDHRLHLKRWELLAMAAVTLVYGVAAFTNLGDTKAPQTYWQSGSEGEQVTFDLGSTQTFRMTYYGNICNSNFTVELSNDGTVWTEPVYAAYAQGEIFRWKWFTPCDEDNSTLYGDTEPTDDGSAYIVYASTEEPDPYQTARYVRITSTAAGLKLCEIGFLSTENEVLHIAALEQRGGNCVTDAQLLTDEQDCVAVKPTYLNSSYFDEIYHARTAYEHLHGMSTYEWTHPPLGKVLIMCGIAIFGMTPFGWRFSGALIGVLMVPLMYLLVKQLTKNSRASLVAMVLLSLDSMHFTQTRIATIDSFAVFWIMVMYLLMIRFIQMPWTTGKEFRRSLITLGACGITMGIAWATKWICIYASAGLAVLLFWRLARHWLAWRNDEDRVLNVPGAILGTLLFCCVFFVAVPVLIYYLSYFWHLRSEGVRTLADMFSGEKLRIVVELQQSIFKYHNGLAGDTHWFRSPWYEWPLIVKPMWYYSGTSYMPEGVISSISCMGNPAVWWFGLIGLLFVILRTAWQRRASDVSVIVLIGFCSQYLPWVLVPRSTFIYHYFASVPFIIICAVLLLEWLREQDTRIGRAVTGTVIGAAVVLFVMFYPLESGMPVARSYAKLLRWFSWYNY